MLCEKASCQSRHADLIFYLVLRAGLNGKTGLPVPHERNPRLDRHHQVKTYLVYLKLASALYHNEGLIFKLEFIILWVSTLNMHFIPVQFK